MKYAPSKQRFINNAIAISIFFILLLMGAPVGAAPGDNLVLDIKVPAGTPDNARIFVAGGHPALGSWNPAFAEARRISPSGYEFSCRIDADARIEFKITRGDWSRVEKAFGGTELENRIAMVSATALNRIPCEVQAWSDLPQAGQQPGEKPQITGDFDIIKNFDSKILKRARNLVVLLPPGYRVSTGERYPVLYMHDGNNLFDPSQSFQGVDWGVDEALASLYAANKIKKIIVVGVYNTAARLDEYTPFVDPKHGGGRGVEYVKFLTDELKPYIDSKYRTLAGAENTAVGGSSLGGLISLYAGLLRPDVFSKMMAMSPSLWWAEKKMMTWAFERRIDLKKTVLWTDIGTAEGEETIANSRGFDELAKKRWSGFAGYSYREYVAAPHNEMAWRARIGEALLHLFKK